MASKTGLDLTLRASRSSLLWSNLSQKKRKRKKRLMKRSRNACKRKKKKRSDSRRKRLPHRLPAMLQTRKERLHLRRVVKTMQLLR